MPDPVPLTLQELNRATLARQLLLQRSTRSPLEVIERLVGLQSQVPEPPYTGLWSRIAGFGFDQLGDLLLQRDVARIVVMRGTVHLVTAGDAVGLRALVQPLIDRQLAGTSWRRVEEGDRVKLIALAREQLAAGPKTMKELSSALRPHWPDAPPLAAATAVRCSLPLVQLPPRGLWGQGGLARHALADEWLDRPMLAHPIEAVVRRYLAAFGPATVADCQQWSGLTQLAPVFASLRPELITFAGPRGEELFDLAEAPRPEAETPAPVRLIPQWDNLLLGYADRSRVMSEEQRRAMATKNGMNPAVVLVDGRVAATYRLVKPKRGATAFVEVAPFGKLTRAAAAAIEQEAAGLLDAMGPPFAGGEARIAAPAPLTPAGDRAAAPRRTAARARPTPQTPSASGGGSARPRSRPGP